MLFNPGTQGLGNQASPLAARPPQGLYLPQGEVTNAWRPTEVPFAGKRPRRSGAQKAGLAYQKRIGAYLSSCDHQWSVVPGPWFVFLDDSGARHYCQPDFILLDEGNSTAVVVEVKLSWTVAAWWQLQRLYLPVLRVAMPESRMLVPLCICRGYDPALPPPEPISLCKDLMEASPSAFNLLVVR